MITPRAYRCDIYRVTRECNVRLMDAHLHSSASRRPFECYCKPTVREIGTRHGEGHLRLVLQLMTGTRQNARELYADMLKAVSRLIAGNPDLINRKTLVADFDSINLGSLRRKAKAMRCGIPASDVLLVLISVKFFQPVQGDLLEMIGDAA